MDGTRTFRFRVGEIEHDSDLNDAIARIREAGANKVSVLAMDFDCAESAAFEVEVPVAAVDHFKRVWRETAFI